MPLTKPKFSFALKGVKKFVRHLYSPVILARDFRLPALIKKYPKHGTHGFSFCFPVQNLTCAAYNYHFCSVMI